MTCCQENMDVEDDILSVRQGLISPRQGEQCEDHVLSPDPPTKRQEE